MRTIPPPPFLQATAVTPPRAQANFSHPRRPPPCPPGPSRLPPRLLQIPSTATRPRPRRIRHRRQSWPPLMGRPPCYHWPSPFPVPPPRDTPCPLCLQYALGDHVVSCPLDSLLRTHYHRWIAARLSQRCHAWRHCASTVWGVLILWGNEPFLLAVDGSPAHGSLPTYTVGRLGAISSPHWDALQHRGLRPANLRRLLCDVVLTTILLHKWHTVPVLPLAGNYSPQKGGPVDKTLVNDPPPEWYHVANWSPMPGAARWPAWDAILGLSSKAEPVPSPICTPPTQPDPDAHARRD